MLETTTASLLGAAGLRRRVPDSSFTSWSGAKLSRYFCGEKDCCNAPDRDEPSAEEMDRRRQEFNKLLQQADAERLARAKKQNQRYARPV